MLKKNSDVINIKNNPLYSGLDSRLRGNDRIGSNFFKASVLKKTPEVKLNHRGIKNQDYTALLYCFS